MVNYFKTQWWRLLCGFMCFIYCIVIAWTSGATADSIDGLYHLLGDVIRFGTWFIASCFWFIISFISYNEECIKALNKRIEALENRAITDIDEISKNNFIVRRKLGPDK